MIVNILTLIDGLLLAIFFANFLVAGAPSIARRFNIPSL